MRSIKMLDSSTVALQWEAVTIAKSPYYFDIAIGHFRSWCNVCNKTRWLIVGEVVLEFGLKKMQQKCSQDSLEMEKAATERLQNRSEDTTVTVDSQLSLAETADD